MSSQGGSVSKTPGKRPPANSSEVWLPRGLWVRVPEAKWSRLSVPFPVRWGLAELLVGRAGRRLPLPRSAAGGLEAALLPAGTGAAWHHHPCLGECQCARAEDRLLLVVWYRTAAGVRLPGPGRRRHSSSAMGHGCVCSHVCLLRLKHAVLEWKHTVE